MVGACKTLRKVTQPKGLLLASAKQLAAQGAGMKGATARLTGV